MDTEQAKPMSVPEGTFDQPDAPADHHTRPRDVIGQIGGVYPASAPRRPPPDAPARGMAEFGQGERGAAGYEDHGDSEVFWVPPEQTTGAITPVTEEVDRGRQDLIAGLNEDLAGEYQAIISYITYAALVGGPYRPQLAAFFRAEVADEHGHAQYLADKIAALGGEPTVTAKPVVVTRDAREMLELIRQAEIETIDRYQQRIAQADQVGEIGLKVQLEQFVAEETEHKEEVEKMLRQWA